jgi:valyl-tRNA synthetase
MFGMKFMGDVPFREVYIHGLVRDADGQKMSKSKGNVLDPLDIIDGIELEPLVAKRTTGLMQPRLAPKIEKHTRRHYPEGIAAHGTDALRFTFASLATTGRDVVFDMGRVDGYRNFCNKLWNAARYVLMNTEGEDCGADGGEVSLSAADRWIVSRLQKAEREVTEGITQYRLDHAAQALYQFIWDEYCDWYLELSKPVLQQSQDAAQLRGTRRTLVRVLEAVLRLAHPIMPFITEEIWQRVAPLAGVTGDTISTRPYPVPDSSREDAAAEAEVAWMQSFILGIRRIRGEMNIAPGKPLPVLLQNASAEDRDRVERNRWYLDFLARLESVRFLDAGEPAPESALALVGDMELRVPMAGLIDKEAELARLSKERGRLAQDLARVEAKLANESFVDKAPEAIVRKERDRQSDLQSALARIDEQYRRIEAI